MPETVRDEAIDRAFVTQRRRQLERLLLRPSEAADVAGVSRTTAYMLLASGAWPKVIIGKSIRVPLDGLREWIARNTITAQVDSPVGDPRQQRGL